MSRTRDAYAVTIGTACIYFGAQLIADVAMKRRIRARATSSLERSAELANDVAGLLDRSAGVEHNFVGNAHVCGLCLTPRAHPLHAPDVEHVEVTSVWIDRSRLSDETITDAELVDPDAGA